MNVELEKILQKITNVSSDINEHIPTLTKYGKECEHITEMGVRGIVSTWALLASMPKKLISYDIENPNKWGGDINKVYEISKDCGVDFQFIQKDVLTIEIEKTDLLFIDTWHVYDQLKEELKLHAKNVNKYMIFHDVVSYGEVGEPSYDVNEKHIQRKGINYAIDEFLKDNEDWEEKERFLNNNGLLILKRK